MPSKDQCARMEAGREGVTSTRPALEHTQTQEVRTMSHRGQYTDPPGQGNSEHPQNEEPRAWRDDTDWLRLGIVVAGLKRKVEAAIAARDERAGTEAHADLLCAEWRLQQAGRRRK